MENWTSFSLPFLIMSLLNSSITSSNYIKHDGGFSFINFKKIENRLLVKNDSFLSRESVSVEEDCWFLCVGEPNCRTVNVISVTNSLVHYCELFNTKGADVDEFLVEKSNSYFMQFKEPPSICDDNPCKNGGECSESYARQDGFACKCKQGFFGKYCQATKYVLFDFESGRLDEWVLTGTVFNNQPTYGDNPIARNRGQPSNHKGDWWIGSHENCPSPSYPRGQVQGDGPTGTMTSPPFQIKCTKIKFLIGGGYNVNSLRMELLIGGTIVAKATGVNSETMVEKSFDVTSYRGQTAKIRIVDSASSYWGHINIDHIVDDCSG